MNRRNRFGIIATSFLALASAGCPPRGGNINVEPLPPPAPLDRTIRQINQNTSKITKTLRALGDVDGQFRDPDGVVRHYNLDGTMFYLPPNYFRFSLKSLGDTKFIMGSNEDWYWFLDPNNKENHCGKQGEYGVLPPDVPIRPDQVVDALGLRPIPTESTADELLVQRIDNEYQQILFIMRSVGASPSAQPVILKEYWLNLRNPGQITRVIFRDRNGVVEMDAHLGAYKTLESGGPLLATELEAVWPKQEAKLRIRVQRWSAVPEVLPDSPQFETPEECLKP